MDSIVMLIILMCSTQPNELECHRWWEKCLDTAYDSYADIAVDLGGHISPREVERQSYFYCVDRFKEIKK